ncbi:DHHA1 domain-containing protein, partial [uncultured Duncaniella sp.]
VELRKQAEEFMKERTRSIAAELVAAAVGVNGCKVVSMIGVRAPEMVKNVAFLVRQLSPEATAFIAATSDISGKPLLTVALTDDLVKKGVNASTMVREAAKAIKGGGGGQPGFAQAGGKDTDGLSVAIETLRQSLM